MYIPPIEKNEMEHQTHTDPTTSIVILSITGLLKIAAWITASNFISILTILSLSLAVIYHAFGVYERYRAFKKNKT
jgi:hypothetical protein